VVVQEGRLPAVLDLVRGGALVGHIFICLDNIAVVCTDPELKRQWETRLIRNAKHLGVFPFKDEGANQWSDKDFHYIGIHYANGRWRHDVDRVERWVKRYGGAEQVGAELGADSVQSVVGVLVWDTRLRNVHMKRLREVFRAQAQMLKGDSSGAPTSAQRDLFASLWEQLLANEWQDVGRDWPIVLPSPSLDIYVVTDASDTKWSWVEMRDGRALRNPSGPFPADVACLQIYYKELHAVVLSLRALAREGVRNARVVLVGDSRAVMGSLSKLLAPPEAWAAIDEVEEICVSCQLGLVLKWVESDGNVAHSATHDEPITGYRRERSWLLATSPDYVAPPGGTGPRDREGNLRSAIKRERD